MKQQQLAKNPRLYEDRQGNVKAKRPAKNNAKTKSVAESVAKSVAKSVASRTSFSPEASSRPEDKYGVRRRPPARRGKSLGAAVSSSASRSRDSRRVGLAA